MDTLNIQFDEQIKKTSLEPSIHNWNETDRPLSSKIQTDDKNLIQTSSNLLSNIIGESYEAVQKAKLLDIQDLDKSIVNNYVNEIISLNPILSQKVTITIGDLYNIIEKYFINQNNFEIATALVYHRKKLRVEPKKLEVKIIRRNKSVVKWNKDKIEIALRKAFIRLGLDSSPAEIVADAVEEKVALESRVFLYIEDIQNMVQKQLYQLYAKTSKDMYLDVLEHYIEYRTMRSVERVKNVESSTNLANLTYITKNGTTEQFNERELDARIEFASTGLNLCMDSTAIKKELCRSIFDGMQYKDIEKTIILNSKSLIEKDADFRFFSGRILLSYIYEEVLGWSVLHNGINQLQSFHQKHFLKYLQRAEELELISPSLCKRYSIDKLSKALDPTADYQLDFLGISTLYERYFLKDKSTKHVVTLETPQIFFMRVAMGLFLKDTGNVEKRVISLYEIYKTKRFMSSTPTLFNSGTNHSQLSSCYLYEIQDDIESILEQGVAKNGYLSKWAGGLGGSWTKVRGTGSFIKGTNGESQGLIPFLKLHNDQLVAVNQGGKRKGSGCAYLEPWHNDIMDFLELRKNVGDERRRCHDMNTALWIPDLFMQRLEQRKPWTLFRSNEVKDLTDLYGSAFTKRYEEYEELAKQGKIWSKTIDAIDLWKAHLKMLFESGHPWVTFKDPCNIRSPQDHAGVIHSSNLCTEITLNTSRDEVAVCNLGSINLEEHITNGKLDHAKLKETITIAIRALDNVIDLNFYPIKEAQNSNLKHRPIGLGVMGLHHALFKMNINFESQEALDFNDEFMEAVSYYSIEASSELAKEKGTYKSFDGSKWSKGILPIDTISLLEKERNAKLITSDSLGKSEDQIKYLNMQTRLDWNSLRTKIKENGMRNSNVMAIAPTATISNIIGTSPCIEPLYKNLYVKSNMGGEFIVLNPYLIQDLKNLNLWNSDLANELKYYDGDLNDIDVIPIELKLKYKTAFGIDYKWLIDAAALRQKWIDQSQSLNLFLPHPDLKVLSWMYRSAWASGLKTTYYLRTLGASNIEKATVDVKKAKRDSNTDEPCESCQ